MVASPNPAPQTFLVRRSLLRDRPPAWLVFGLVCVFVLPVALIPSERGGFLRLPFIPTLWWSVAWLMLFAGVAIACRTLSLFGRRVTRTAAAGLLIPILLLCLWQTISLAWNGRDRLMREYSLVETIASGSAFVAAVLLTSGLSHRPRHQFGAALTVLIAAIAAVYMSLSFLFPDWRPSSAWIDRTNPTLGFIRVFGPLGTPTTLNFVLLPALGFALGRAITRSMGFFFWILLAGFLCLSVIMTGSRGGVLSLAAFCLLMPIATRARAMIALVPLAVVFGAGALFTGIPERFRSFEDQGRTETYRTALRAWSDGLGSMTVGVGHGALYSKLHDDSLRKLHGKTRWYLSQDDTRYGSTLRSSHSSIIRSLAETGVIGLGLQLLPLVWVLFHALAPRYHQPRAPTNVVARSCVAGCAACIPYIGLEEFFLGAFWPVTLWAMFAVIAVETLADCRQAASEVQGQSRPAGASVC